MANALQNSYITQALTPQSVAATTETTGTVIDLQGVTNTGTFSDIVFILTSATGSDTTGTFVVKEGTDGSTFSTTVGSVTYNQSSAVGTYMISIRLGGPRARYLRCSHTAGNATARVIAAIAVGCNPAYGVNGSSEALRATNAGLVARTVV
jgi:hypothetical protein